MASKLKTVAEMTPEEVSVKIAEYQSAEAMLCHYDNLNWRIGSIFIAGVTVLTGIILNKKLFEFASSSEITSLFILYFIPAFSLFILYCWLRWFERHKDFYNFRNEVLHRLEIELRMYNHLLNIKKVKALENNDKDEVKEIERKRVLKKILDESEKRANHHKEEFQPFFEHHHNKTAGRDVARYLTFGIPFFQFLFILGVLFKSLGELSYASGVLGLFLIISFFIFETYRPLKVNVRNKILFSSLIITLFAIGFYLKS